MKILDLPFHERPVLELLDLADRDRREVNREYAGYGWARVGSLWLRSDGDERSPNSADLSGPGLILASPESAKATPVRISGHCLDTPVHVDDVLVLALHAADDGTPLSDDIELLFELPDAAPAIVLASQFMAQWVPLLPRASAIVLALCNPHRARLRFAWDAPVYAASGDVTAWIDDDSGAIELCADGSWARLTA